MAHDSHHLLVMGPPGHDGARGNASMKWRRGGGLHRMRKTVSLALPFFSLLSDDGARWRRIWRGGTGALRAGNAAHTPILHLSFLALTVRPNYKFRPGLSRRKSGASGRLFVNPTGGPSRPCRNLIFFIEMEVTPMNSDDRCPPARCAHPPPPRAGEGGRITAPAAGWGWRRRRRRREGCRSDSGPPYVGRVPGTGAPAFPVRPLWPPAGPGRAGEIPLVIEGDCIHTGGASVLGSDDAGAWRRCSSWRRLPRNSVKRALEWFSPSRRRGLAARGSSIHPLGSEGRHFAPPAEAIGGAVSAHRQLSFRHHGAGSQHARFAGQRHPMA